MRFVKNSYGLPKSHAYTILGAYKMGKINVIKIRNPWGAEKYSGSLADSKLTAAQKNQLGGHISANDGIYYMTMEEYRTCFKSVIVTFYDDWKRSHKDASWDRVSKITDAKNSAKFVNPTDQRAILGVAGA
jgi:hypothetical protein